MYLIDGYRILTKNIIHGHNMSSIKSNILNRSNREIKLGFLLGKPCIPIIYDAKYKTTGQNEIVFEIDTNSIKISDIVAIMEKYPLEHYVNNINKTSKHNIEKTKDILNSIKSLL